jgi:hypothetical protein
MLSFGRRRSRRSRSRRSRSRRSRSRRSRSRRSRSRRGPRGGKIHIKPKGMTCKKFLSMKIADNMREFKEGKFKSREQAIAVAYSQVRKGNPRCKF